MKVEKATRSLPLGTDFIYPVAKLPTLTQPLPEGEEKTAPGIDIINQLKTPPHKFTYEGFRFTITFR